MGLEHKPLCSLDHAQWHVIAIRVSTCKSYSRGSRNHAEGAVRERQQDTKTASQRVYDPCQLDRLTRLARALTLSEVCAHGVLALHSRDSGRPPHIHSFKTLFLAHADTNQTNRRHHPRGRYNKLDATGLCDPPHATACSWSRCPHHTHEVCKGLAVLQRSEQQALQLPCLLPLCGAYGNCGLHATTSRPERIPRALPEL